jgi:diaminohydroxyphosphoribosylaminopyrimidine deaminase/5-amino-6-(5-phosphoribosylamino)uracil reductase
VDRVDPADGSPPIDGPAPASTDAEDLVGRADWAAVNSTGRPFVVYKFAATLDGRIAAADGTSRWITGPESRAEVHRLRAACAATVVGSGTQQADDPQLAVRDAPTPDGQPLRVVIDTRARTPADARVLDGAADTLIAVADDADARHLTDAVRAGRVEVLRVPRAEAGLDLPAVLAGLGRRGVRAVFLEGGPTLAGSFVAAGLVDRVIAYLAPALLGAGRSGLLGAGIGTVNDRFRMDLVQVGRSGPDVRIVARPTRPPVG